MDKTVPKIKVIDTPVTALPFDKQVDLMMGWAKQGVSKTVCVANVHMLMEAYWHQDLDAVLKGADLVTPDGMPLVWMMKLQGFRTQNRVAGMDILLSICHLAEKEGSSLFFVGSTPDVLGSIEAKLKQDFPNLKIAGMEPLPFRPLTPAEDEALIEKINCSGAGFVCVSLGCPKQEYWMAQHQGKIHAVMIGLGGAFKVYAGMHKRAPRYVRELGFEWLYRLLQEPRRLWGRYALTIPPFMWLALRQIVSEQGSQPISPRRVAQ